MPIRKSKYTPAEIAWAKRRFARAAASGTLKPPQAIGALGLGSGYRQSLRASTVTYRDYLREARRALRSGRGSHKPSE